MAMTEKIRYAITADSGGATKPLKDLQNEAKKTESALDRMGNAVGVSGEALKAGLVSIGAVLSGRELVQFLQGSVEAFTDAAEAANLLSRATNATVEDASRFYTIAKRFGLDTNDLIEIFSDFQQAVAASGDELEDMGVTIAKAEDGTTDWVKTTQNFLREIQKIGDATERNRLLFKYFGEEGAKQITAMVNSGEDLDDLLNSIDVGALISTQDIRAAQDYRRALDQMALAGDELRIALARGLLPFLTQAANVATPIVNAFGSINTSLLLAAGAAGALGFALRTDLAQNVISGVTSSLGKFGSAVTGLVTGQTSAATGARRLGGGLVAVGRAVGPLAAVTAGLWAFQEAIKAASNIEDFTKSTENARYGIVALAEQYRKNDSVWSSLESFLIGPGTGNASPLNGSILQITRSLREQAEETLASADATDEQKRAAEALIRVQGDGTLKQRAQNSITKEGKETVLDFTEAMRGAEGVREAAIRQNRTLNDLLADGSYSQEELASAVEEAADAQRDQNRITEESSALMDAYAASTWDAVNATLAMQDKRYAAAEAERRFKDTVEESNKVLNDPEASARDRARALDDVGQAALTAAEAEVEYQRQLALTKGEVLDEKAANEIRLETLRKLEEEATTKKQRREIRKLIEEIETAQTTASEGATFNIETSGFGTTQRDLERLARDRTTYINVKYRLPAGGPSGNKPLPLSMAITPPATQSVATLTGAGFRSARSGSADTLGTYTGGSRILAPQKRDGTTVNVYLDSKQIASYVQPGGVATEPRVRRP